jgi:hypothetical protein
MQQQQQQKAADAEVSSLQSVKLGLTSVTIQMVNNDRYDNNTGDTPHSRNLRAEFRVNKLRLHRDWRWLHVRLITEFRWRQDDWIWGAKVYASLNIIIIVLLHHSPVDYAVILISRVLIQEFSLQPLQTNHPLTIKNTVLKTNRQHSLRGFFRLKVNYWTEIERMKGYILNDVIEGNCWITAVWRMQTEDTGWS